MHDSGAERSVLRMFISKVPGCQHELVGRESLPWQSYFKGSGDINCSLQDSIVTLSFTEYLYLQESSKGKLSQLSQMLHKIRSGQPPKAMPASWHTREEVCLHHLSKEIHPSGQPKGTFDNSYRRRDGMLVPFAQRDLFERATWSQTWEFTQERDGMLVPFVQRDSPMGVP